MSLTIWIVAGGIASALSPAPPPVEIACSALVQTEGGATEVVNDKNLRVLEQGRDNGFFVYDRENTRAIRCMRSDIVPAVTDEVLGAGFPLYIVRASDGDTRIGVLEVSGGQFRFRMLQGELTADEKERLLVRLKSAEQCRSQHVGQWHAG